MLNLYQEFTMELPTILDPQALSIILTKFTKTSAVSNRELAAAVHHLAGYFAGVIIKDGDKIPVFLGANDSTENNLLTAIAELEKDSGLEPKEMASPSGNPIVTALVVKFIMLALTKWLEKQANS
jgi:hypothetical protein